VLTCTFQKGSQRYSRGDPKKKKTVRVDGVLGGNKGKGANDSERQADGAVCVGMRISTHLAIIIGISSEALEHNKLYEHEKRIMTNFRCISRYFVPNRQFCTFRKLKLHGAASLCNMS
jgi:hypothetical protein